MAYCPECGSEVAPIDTFCPYCGIALQSAIPEQSSANEAVSSDKSDFESLSVEQNSNDAAPDQVETQNNVENPANDKPAAISASAAFSDENKFSDSAEFSPSVADKNTLEGRMSMKTESIELNLPSEEYLQEKIISKAEDIEEDFTDFQPEPVREAEPNKVQDAVETEPEDFSDEPYEEKAIDSGSFDSEKDFQPEMVSENHADAEEKAAEKDAAEDLPTVEEADFQATIPYTPPDFQNKKESAKSEFAEQETPKEETSPAESANDSALEAEKKIDIPEIPMPEPVISTPLYISIQPKQETETPLEMKANETFAPPANVPQTAPENVKEDRSFTSPNIGVSDTDGKKSAKLKPLDEGTVLSGRYEVVRKIGGGGMGAVYLASDQNLGGVLRAVKEMVQSYIEEEQQEKAINDFRRESMILSTLDHPSIPTIYDYFYDEKESRFYLVMKYINGGDLSARLRSAPEGRLDEKTVTEWAIQIADVLDYLHNRPTTIIYRDLKPSNVMIDGNSGRVMLIDFGIARSVNKEEKGVTAVGTMGYAPPELFSGNVEPRSDIYSLGSTMFHLLTGADPQSNPLLIFDFNKNPRPRQINSRLSDQIEQIIMRAVEYNSGQRFNSAAEMRENLAKHLENLQKGGVTYGISNAAAGTAPAAVNTPVFCGFCGQKIVATDMFCPFCGAQQPLAGQAQGAQSAGFAAAPKLTARLMVIGTNELDAPEFSLEKETNLVGRRDPMSNIFPEVDLSKFDPQTKISRKHARIWRESNSYMLEDLGSSNGTVLMPPAKDSIRLLPRQPHLLTHGDKIRVGDTTLHFFIG